MTKILQQKLIITAVLYRRVSSEDQATDGSSLEAQWQNGLERARKMEIDVYPEPFTDAGVSATKVPMKKRQGLVQCLEFIQSNKPKYWLVWKRDRLIRDTGEYIQIMKILKKTDTTLVFFGQGEPEYMTGTYGNFQETLLAAIAELESAVTRQRILDTRKNLVLTGEWRISTPPYGYRYLKDTKQYEIIPEQAAIVKNIFRWYIYDNMGAHKISCKLKDEGIRTANGCVFSVNAILRIIRNPFYMGFLNMSYRDQQDGTETKQYVSHESDSIVPIISQEEFQKALNILSGRNQRQHPPRTYSTSFRFSGLIYCKKCCSKMRNRMWTEHRTLKDGSEKTTPYARYICSGSRSGISCFTSLSRNRIEDAVIPEILKFVSNIKPEKILAEAQEQLEI